MTRGGGNKTGAVPALAGQPPFAPPTFPLFGVPHDSTEACGCQEGAGWKSARRSPPPSSPPLAFRPPLPLPPWHSFPFSPPFLTPLLPSTLPFPCPLALLYFLSPLPHPPLAFRPLLPLPPGAPFPPLRPSLPRLLSFAAARLPFAALLPLLSPVLSPFFLRLLGLARPIPSLCSFASTASPCFFPAFSRFSRVFARPFPGKTLSARAFRPGATWPSP